MVDVLELGIPTVEMTWPVLDILSPREKLCLLRTCLKMSQPCVGRIELPDAWRCLRETSINCCWRLQIRSSSGCFKSSEEILGGTVDSKLEVVFCRSFKSIPVRALPISTIDVSCLHLASDRHSISV